MQKNKIGLVWFRNDLRVADNASLANATKECEKVIAVYCFDPRQFEQSKYGDFKKTEKFRTKFNIETVRELKANLEKLNISLFVFNEITENVISSLITDENVSTIYCQNEWTKDEVKIEDAIKSKIDASVEFKTVYDQFLFHPKDIPFDVKDIPNVFKQFRNKCEKSSKIRTESVAKAMPNINLIENKTVIPSLKDLGFEDFEADKRTAFPFKGGENQALKRMENYFWDTENLSSYKITRNGLIGADFSSKFSPWLANGCISAKIIYWQICEYELQVEKNESTYWLIFELIWRDYFKYVSMKFGQKIFKIGGILDVDYDWKTNKNTIDNWINGKTQEPFINANMIELQKTGFMSNRGRQNVGSFFAKNLLLDWRIGAAYFESMLIDYDVHSNYGNWMYVSGVGNDPRDRKFNIKMQAENYDGEGKFQDLWLK
jgi:deoxyribodipyrimidine photo-lyase